MGLGIQIGERTHLVPSGCRQPGYRSFGTFDPLLRSLVARKHFGHVFVGHKCVTVLVLVLEHFSHTQIGLSLGVARLDRTAVLSLCGLVLGGIAVAIAEAVADFSLFRSRLYLTVGLSVD